MRIAFESARVDTDRDERSQNPLAIREPPVPRCSLHTCMDRATLL